MNRVKLSNLGVTLLEIMLVLAIAAMVVVMSIRYYQTATSSQQSNAAMQVVQSITAAADNLAAGTGSYSTSVTQAAVTSVVGTNGMTTPISSTSATVSATSNTTYTVTLPLNVAVCGMVSAKLGGNSKILSPTCNASGTLTYTYDSTK